MNYRALALWLLQLAGFIALSVVSLRTYQAPTSGSSITFNFDGKGIGLIIVSAAVSLVSSLTYIFAMKR